MTAWDIAKQQSLTSSQLLLLLTMIEYSSDNVCKLSLGKLAEYSQLNKQTVMKCVGVLLDKGLIQFSGITNH